MQAPLGGGGGGGHASTSSTPSSSIGKLPILAPLLPSSLTGVVEMTAADGQKHKICQSPTTIKRTNNLNNEEEEDGEGDREGGMYPIKRPKIENDEEEDEEISKFRRRGGSGGETDEVTDEMMLQLLQRWEGENGHNEVLMGVNEQQRQQTCSNKQENNNSVGTKEGEKHSHTVRIFLKFCLSLRKFPKIRFATFRQPG